MISDAEWNGFKNDMLFYLANHENLWNHYREFIDLATDCFLNMAYRKARSGTDASYPSLEEIGQWVIAGGESSQRYL